MCSFLTAQSQVNVNGRRNTAITMNRKVQTNGLAPTTGAWRQLEGTTCVCLTVTTQNTPQAVITPNATVRQTNGD